MNNWGLTAFIFVWLLANVPSAAIQLDLDRRAIEEAMALGQSRFDAERARFHSPYRINVAKAPLDYVEVVTPFRRLVVEAERRARTGDRSFAQRDAFELLAMTGDQIDIHLELTFHPFNTYIGVPDYRVVLLSAAHTGSAIEPRTLARFPRFGPRVDGAPLPSTGGLALPRGSDPMSGGTVIAVFGVTALDPEGKYVVVIEEQGKEIARAEFDLARLR